MSEATAYHDGAFLAPGGVRLSPFDQGLLQGDGVFETLRVEAGRPVDLPAHLDRLLAALEWLQIELPESRTELTRAILGVAGAAPGAVARLRVTVSGGAPGEAATRLITCQPPGAADPAGGVALVVDRDLCILAGDPLQGIKSLSRQRHALALRRARARGAYEALLCNQHGRVAEGTRSNLVARVGGALVTPPASEGCLPGTVRRRLLERGLVSERPLEVDEVLAASELLLTNSMIGVLAVTAIEGRPLRVAGSAARLYEAWRQACR